MVDYIAAITPFLYFTIPSSFTVLTLEQMLHVRPRTNMLVQPIEIACSHHLCAGCLKARLLHSSSLHTIQSMYLHKSYVHILSSSPATIDKGDDCTACQCRVEAVSVDAHIRSSWKEHGATSIYTTMEEHPMHRSTQ